MLFNSQIFLLYFLPVALIGYYGVAFRLGATAAKWWLCAASFVFYGWWNPAFVLLLVGSIAFNYTLSRYLVGNDEAAPRAQSRVLLFGVAANLLLLFHYKYLFPLLGFFDRLGITHFELGSIVLPIGISFFTFTQIGYLVDCREGLVRDRGILNYVLFVTFFPHLIAGPILHHREVMPQFANADTYRLRFDNLAVGLTLFTAGMIKKVLLADMIAPWAEQGFGHLGQIQAIQAWSVTLAYSMQLYFDFSAYSDMALGLGILFGVRLPLNFNSPYKSLSKIDFWQRWHITLTRYLTLLIYNPVALWVTRYRQRAGLTMNRQAAATPSGFASMIMLPTFTTMFLAGVWHGAGLQFMVYGLWEATQLCVNHAWRLFRKPLAAAQALTLQRAWSILWRVALTYFGVLVSQIFFRADSVSDACTLLAGLFGMHGSGLPLTIPLGNVRYLGPCKDWLLAHHVFVVGVRDAYNATTLPLFNNLAIIFGLGVIAFAAPNVYQVLNQWSPALAKVKPASWQWCNWRPNYATAVATGVLLFTATQFMSRPTRFLYFQF